MPLPVELWRDSIEEQQYPEIEFLRRVTNMSAFIQGTVLHLPQAGATPDIVENPTMFPLSVSERDDSELVVNTIRLKSRPILLREAEQFYLSYEKRASLLRQHMSTMRERMAQISMFGWAGGLPTAQTVMTTGATTGRVPAGASATRRRVEAVNIIDLVARLDDMDAPAGRGLLVDSALMPDIRAIADFMRADAIGSSNIPSGAVGRLYGLDVFVRSRLPLANASTQLLKARGSAAAATDSFVAIAFAYDSVYMALSEIDVQEDAVVRPEYGGRLLSLEAHFQAGRLRNDGLGNNVAMLIQASV